MNSQRILPTLEGIAAVVSFVLIFVVAVAGHLAVRAGMDEKTTGTVTRSMIILLFFVFGFACMGLLVHVFVALQVRVGNGGEPMIRFLADHESGVTFAFWGFLGLGSLLALPFALHDLAGIDFKLPLGWSKGILVANVGMTIDEVQKDSTVRMEKAVDLGGHSLASEQMVFEFRIAGSMVRFPQSRYYWLETETSPERRIKVVNIGITPEKLPKPELDTFRHRVQAELLADGWMPGHIYAESEEVVHLWGGNRTSGDGRYWGKGNAVISIETNRMDEEKRGEPPGSGQFIIYLDIRPISEEKKMVFERSAWKE